MRPRFPTDCWLLKRTNGTDAAGARAVISFV